MKFNITPQRLLAAVVSTVLLTAVLLVVGFVIGAQITERSLVADHSVSPMKLMADTAARGKNVSLATGLIDDRNEGLYILDHLNGNLQCWILNPRTNEVGGVYRTNVFEAVPTLKQGGDLDFVLTTGLFNFQNRGNLQPAKSIAYVAEGKSGAVVGFGFQFDKTGIQRGIVQEGLLEVICKGPIRELQLRDQ